jgi:hypothetical protein
LNLQERLEIQFFGATVKNVPHGRCRYVYLFFTSDMQLQEITRPQQHSVSNSYEWKQRAN